VQFGDRAYWKLELRKNWLREDGEAAFTGRVLLVPAQALTLGTAQKSITESNMKYCPKQLQTARHPKQRSPL
jgi:hypothetical protein